MRKFHPLMAVAAFAALALMLPAAAEEPAHYTFSPKPPGTIVQSQVVYLSGEAMHSQWRAVASKMLAGTGHGQSFYRWYLSIYAIDDTTYDLKYQSPTQGGPLGKVVQATGAKMWFPLQELKIVGAAQLMAPGVQQLVVRSHETGADCGAATVTILTTDARHNVVPAVTLRNGCDLSAAIVHGKTGDSIALSGPYYGPKAAMCCPTKPKATATLRYRNGTWTETPKYYDLYVGKFPPT